MKLEPESQKELKITQCEGSILAHKFPLLVFKETNQFVNTWSNYLDI